VWILVGSFAYLILVAAIFKLFLAQHEVAMDLHGYRPPDPIMNALPAFDLSTWIFLCTYGAIVVYILYERKKPFFLEKGLIAYGTLIALRMLTLTFVPWLAPDDLVFLNDPFLNNVAYPGEIENDLFFSGHVGLALVLGFLARRVFFFVLACILGIFLMIQRVHYSYDILGALPFAWAVAWFVEKVLFARLSRTN
jgi:hypothetical protein